MLEQFAIFSPQGQVVYQYNCLGKRFTETQINKFIAHLVTSPSAQKNDHNRKYSIINIGSGLSGKNSRGFCTMYHITKQPELYYLATYSEQSLQLNEEAEELLTLAVSLWESLKLNEGITENLKGNGEKNEHNYTDILAGLDDEIKKFDQYLRVKYEDSIKKNEVVKVKADLESLQRRRNVDSKNIKKKTGPKNAGGRKWGQDGMMEEIGSKDATLLDFSTEGAETSSSSNFLNSSVEKDSFGNRTETGEFLIKEIDELLTKEKKSEQNAEKDTTINNAFGFLKKHVFGNKTITEKDLNSILEQMKQQLITKNVAPEAADFLTEQVSRDLVGSKTASWTSVEITARESLTKALTQILTPGISVDLLHEIQQKSERKEPYVFSVVGVNGVGKSTNLSKLAFWLLQNNFNVLIVACDTFRSGAVEQLRVHVENLAQLTDESHVRGSRNKRGKSGNDHVELFEAGYGGSDLVTKIAKQAIKYAKDQSFDVVLMDTAGRRHNDPTLMSPLKSFAEQANPDKIIMVGEALVGTDSVQQAKNFNNAFGRVRNIDFFIVSKCDTVGQMLGAMVNMVYATGIPILFVGVGQTYTDLRTLSVNWAVNTLMS